MAKIIKMSDSDGVVYPVPSHIYKGYPTATENDSITLNSGIWLIMTGRYNVSTNTTLGLYVATIRPTLTGKIQIAAIKEPATGITITPDTSTGNITVATTVTNTYVCALVLHTV